MAKFLPPALVQTVLLGLAVLLLLGTTAAEARQRVVKSLLETRHEHVTIQHWDISCGAAALATLLDYQYGDDVTERDVATALMQRAEYLQNPRLVQLRQGFSLLDLKRYADSRGYEGVGLGKMEFKDLIERAPIMVPVNTLGYNHFVIFRGVLGNRVLLADPAWGNRTMLTDQFMQMWINFPQLGRVGFVVKRKDGIAPPNRLAARSADFVTLR